MMNDRSRAQLTRWLNTTRLPLPYELRTLLLDVIVGAKLCRVKLPVDDLYLELDLADSMQANVYLDNAWEPVLSNWAAFFASRGAQVIADVGAQVGYFTLLMLHYAPDAVLHAFEPNPAAFKQLKRNADLNGLRATLNQAAIAEGDNSAEAFHRPHRFQLGVGRLGQLAHSRETIFVQTTSLDNYAARHGLPRIDLVKMDIEGSEAQALPGMTAGLKAGFYGALLIEFHQHILAPAESQAALDLLRDSGYHLYEIHLDRLVASRSIKTAHLCALSPQTHRDLGSPEVEYKLPPEFRPPYPLADISGK